MAHNHQSKAEDNGDSTNSHANIIQENLFLLGRLKTLESLDFREKHAACKGDNIMFGEDVGNVYMVG